MQGDSPQSGAWAKPHNARRQAPTSAWVAPKNLLLGLPERYLIRFNQLPSFFDRSAGHWQPEPVCLKSCSNPPGVGFGDDRLALILDSRNILRISVR